MARRLTLLGVLCALLAFTATAQAATIWTPMNSGTTSTISSIVYQSPTRFWYATTGGTIAFWNGSAFVAGTGITPGENFTDLAFQPGGSVGYAITTNGHVWRSTDAGVSWTQLAAPTTRSDCSGLSVAQIETELNAVQWANPTTVFLMGNNSTILRSSNADAATPTFTEINKVVAADGNCAIQQEGFSENFTDATFLAANPQAAFFVAQDFGRLYQSSNALIVGASGTKVNGDTVNSFTGNPRIARDAGNPNRLWIVDHEAGGSGCGVLCLQVSTDGGTSASAAAFPNRPSVTGGLYDISSQGGVEVAAGSGGEIFTSVDGTNFYHQPAGGTLATENWRAEAAYDAAHAAVGGENGALAITAAANTIPDTTAPTGTIAGPTTVTSGQATRYAAVVADNAGGSGINPSSYTWTAPGFAAQHGATATYTFPRGAGGVTLTVRFADNAGNAGTATLHVTVRDAAPPGPPTGSRPATRHTGQATIRIYRIVTVTGRSGRFVPVIVSTARPRRFTVQIRPLRGRRALATSRFTLAGRHGGRGTIRVKLPARVTPGTYYIAVRVARLNGKPVGKLVRLRFALR
jgi:Photosynthesis system II assembly factor YCF48